MPNDRIEAEHIDDALQKRETSEDAETREVLRRLATGLLRQFQTGTYDPIMSPLASLLGVDEQAQVAQRTVDWHLEGRRDNPPFPERPQFRGIMRPLCQQKLGRDATFRDLNVLLNALVGIERDVVLSPGPTARMIITAKLVDAYALGQ